MKSALGLIGGAALAGADAAFGQLQGADRMPGDMSRTALQLKREGGIVVGVLNDPVFAGEESTRGLDFSAFREAWGKIEDVRVLPLDKYEIRSYSIVFRSHLDILVYPYGPSYPMDAFPSYTGDTIDGFLRRGGAVLTTGGVPFSRPVSDKGEVPPGDAPDALSLNGSIYTRWVAPLGYKYYAHPYKPPRMGVDRQFLPSVPARVNLPGSQLGLIVNNSSHEPVPQPFHGKVFAERYPARSITTLFWGEDSYGQVLATNGVLVQDFETGSRRLHLTHDPESHPLATGSPFFAPLMDNLLSLLCNRIVVKDVATNYACYRDGEEVIVQAEFVSFDSSETGADIAVEIKSRDAVVDSHRETVTFSPMLQAFKEWRWSPKAFADDEYTVTVQVVRNGQSLSRGRNGFVVWKEEVVRRASSLSANGNYFHKSDGETFLTGTNYYESTRGEIMWFRPDVSRICADLRQMRDCGVNYIRPHYHHLKWFKDYLEFQHGRLLPYYSALEALESPIPDEPTWRMLDVFIYLCQKHGIVYGGDLFTLVPEEMGDPRGWFPLVEAVVSEDKRAAAKQFFQAVNARYKNAPCIAWDLWNEPEVPLPLLQQWTDGLRRTLTESGAQKLITVGGGSGEKLGNSVDFLGLHMDATKVRNAENHSDKPAMAQEVYLDHAEDLTSELVQAEDMREGMFAAIYQGLAGFAPWSWARQMRLWQDSYVHDPVNRMESWDDRLGSQVHDDGTLKPAGQVFRDISVALRSIHLTKYDRSDKSLWTDLGQVTVKLKGLDGAEGYSLMHFNDQGCLAAIARGAVSWRETNLIGGPPQAYVYALSEGAHIGTALKLMLKSEAPGQLRVYGRSSPRSVTLADIRPGDIKTVDTLAWATKENCIEITTKPTQQAYWVIAEW